MGLIGIVVTDWGTTGAPGSYKKEDLEACVKPR